MIAERSALALTLSVLMLCACALAIDDAGDLQYLRHTSVANNNLIYWKTTKDFADGCSSHLHGGRYADGNVALPDQAAFIIEGARFEGAVTLEANHHCGTGGAPPVPESSGDILPRFRPSLIALAPCLLYIVACTIARRRTWLTCLRGLESRPPPPPSRIRPTPTPSPTKAVTGMLCQPTYVLDRVTWASTAAKWMYFTNFGGGLFGGVFVLAPPEMPNAQGHIFPAGYVALASSSYPYLLQLRDTGGSALCVSAVSLGVATRYDNGILCRAPLRTIKVYSRGLTRATAVSLLVEIWQGEGLVTSVAVPFDQRGGDGETRKQGYAFPVVPHGPELSCEYRISLAGGAPLPQAWVVEFSSPMMGNRWAADEISLRVAGRTCPDRTSSQHDRRFLWAGVADEDHLGPEAWGRGACTGHEDMPIVRCSAEAAEVSVPECAECDADGEDVCAAARCAPGGTCTARWLGGTLAASRSACACSPPFGGPLCDRNPCAEKNITCSGHGTCVGTGGLSWRCECEAGHSGLACEVDCNAVCPGEFPYGCNLGVDKPFHFCSSNGACAYVDSAAEAPPGYCGYKTRSACDAVSCEAPNDCHLAGGCDDSTGGCAPPERMEDGTPCNSIPLGVCHEGVCRPASPSAPPLPPRPLNAPAASRPSSEAASSSLCTEASCWCILSLCVEIRLLALGGVGMLGMLLVCVLLLLVWLCCRYCCRRRQRRNQHSSTHAGTDSSEQPSTPVPARRRSSRRTSFVALNVLPTRRAPRVDDGAGLPLRPPAPPSQPLPDELPEGWEAHLDGDVVYFADADGNTQWERPTAPAVRPTPSARRMGAGGRCDESVNGRRRETAFC